MEETVGVVQTVRVVGGWVVEDLMVEVEAGQGGAEEAGVEVMARGGRRPGGCWRGRWWWGGE